MAKTPVSKNLQEAATSPRVRDAFGFELDAEGLPLSGPERARRMAEQSLLPSRAREGLGEGMA